MMRFSSYHPAVSAVFFLSVLIITMFTTNPMLLLLAFLGGIGFCLKSDKGARNIKSFCFYLLFFALVSLTNPLFSHNGVTPLFFLNGNPVTLEALLYGLDIGLMLLAVIFWFKCLNLVITEDKLLFLFGRISPKLALLISSALRFIPLLKEQSAKIRQTQKSMGLFAGDAWTDKLKGTVRVYSSLITWALENAADMGSSMKARGYGLKGRSVYSLYRFRRADGILLVLILCLDAVIFFALASGRLAFDFYPQITVFSFDIYSIWAMAAFAILSFLPFILEVKEDLQWNCYRSKI